MKKIVLIPTYWSPEKAIPWKEGDAVYDHPTPLDEEGTLGRTLESMKILSAKDYQLVLLICPTTPEIADAAEQKVKDIIRKADLHVETYLFTIPALDKMTDILSKAGVISDALTLLSLSGYANVRNMCLLAASVLGADAAILIDDDEVFEKPDFIDVATGSIGKQIDGNTIFGMAGYYLNKHDQYYDDVKPEAWMTYWDRYGIKAKAFDKIIGCSPRIKQTPFAFGGAMIIHRDLYKCIPFDPCITRGEDIDYLINSKMYRFDFYLDNTLSIKHLPVPKKHPQWKRIREDIYRFIYERAKINSQYKTEETILVSPEDFDPYPGEFLRDDLEEMIYNSNMMLAVDYMNKGDTEGCQESLNNIYIGKNDAVPAFDAFSHYRETQKNWEQLMSVVLKNRKDLNRIMTAAI